MLLVSSMYHLPLPLVKMYIHVFLPSLIQLFIFFILLCKSSLYIMNKISLSGVCIRIFFPDYNGLIFSLQCFQWANGFKFYAALIINIFFCNSLVFLHLFKKSFIYRILEWLYHNFSCRILTVLALLCRSNVISR